MQIEVLAPVGAVVHGLAVTDVDAGRTAELRDLLARHGVLVFRDQQVDDDSFRAFLAGFGPLTFTVGETPVAGFPDLNVISNVGRTTPPRSQFHVDTSYVAAPPSYTALRTVAVPSQGGQTLFTNQYRAYETLPQQVRSDLDGRSVLHRVTGLDLEEGAETEAEHPVFRVHPVSGRTSLYLSTPERCVAVSGMSAADSARTIEFLLEHSTAEGNVLRHAWAPGDVVIWDNACVLHRADHSGVVGDRVMHRGMVSAAGYAAA